MAVFITFPMIFAKIKNCTTRIIEGGAMDEIEEYDYIQGLIDEQCQRSSAVEQRPVKALVASSILAVGVRDEMYERIYPLACIELYNPHAEI
jgi:hypothetical protein